jgi:hypothetical protein
MLEACAKGGPRGLKLTKSLGVPELVRSHPAMARLLISCYTAFHWRLKSHSRCTPQTPRQIPLPRLIGEETALIVRDFSISIDWMDTLSDLSPVTAFPPCGRRLCFNTSLCRPRGSPKHNGNNSPPLFIHRTLADHFTMLPSLEQIYS